MTVLFAVLCSALLSYGFRSAPHEWFGVLRSMPSVQDGSPSSLATAPAPEAISAITSADDLLHARTDLASAALVARTQTATFDCPLRLESGQHLPVVNIAYQTYGTLNRQRTNAVLVCHALSGDAHAAGVDPATGKLGWWDNMIGPGKGIDTNRYFVIATNVIGGCRGSTGPACINPETGKPYGREFPVITISDMVDAQRWLVDELGITQLLAVVGGSMGGMQALDWAVRYPQRVRNVIAIATTARLNAQAIAFDAVGRNAILMDRGYQDGRYYAASGGTGHGPDAGLAIARMVGHITYLSEESMHAKFGRRLRTRDAYGYDFASEFSIETYLDHQGNKFVERFDANSYLYITKAMDYFDLALAGRRTDRKRGENGHATSGVLDVSGVDLHPSSDSLAESLARARARFLVVSFSSDWLFTPAQAREIVDALLASDKDVSYCNIKSPYGHDAFLLEPATLGAAISGFLNADPVLGDGCSASAASRPPAVIAQPGPVALASVPARNGRGDLDTILKLIEPASHVLDVGCGNGELLCRLRDQRQVTASGIELDQAAVITCMNRGLTVRQGDADEGLDQYRDGQFDYVILSQTLQNVRRPDVVVGSMIRKGRRAIVSFPNFAYWRVRMQLLTRGRAPKTEALPEEWYSSSSIHFLSLRDFEAFCDQIGARVLTRIPLVGTRHRRVTWWPNLRAEEAVYVITKA